MRPVLQGVRPGKLKLVLFHTPRIHALVVQCEVALHVHVPYRARLVPLPLPSALCPLARLSVAESLSRSEGLLAGAAAGELPAATGVAGLAHCRCRKSCSWTLGDAVAALTNCGGARARWACTGLPAASEALSPRPPLDPHELPAE